jgi:glucokinase
MNDTWYILADVGGTNTRLAYGYGNDIAIHSQRRFQNENFKSFDAVLSAFLDEQPPPKLTGGCFAIAGPVGQDTAQLTNRNWTIDAARARKLTASPELHLVNDMSALGCSIQTLKPAQTQSLRSVATRRANGQSLVVGLGTGVNVSLTMGSVVMAAELGHTGLPNTLESAMGRLMSKPETGLTVEQLFSGTGFENLYFRLSGTKTTSAKIAALITNGTDTHATETHRIYTTLLGLFLREVALCYLPHDGIFLAGSVARGLLTPGNVSAMLAGFDSDHPMADVIRTIPLSLITDDAAALQGCLEIAKARS